MKAGKDSGTFCLVDLEVHGYKGDGSVDFRFGLLPVMGDAEVLDDYATLRLVYLLLR